MLAEFSLVRFQVQTGKKGKPPLMVLPNLPLPWHQMKALAVAQYRCRQMEEETDAFSAGVFLAGLAAPTAPWANTSRVPVVPACLPPPPRVLVSV